MKMAWHIATKDRPYTRKNLNAVDPITSTSFFLAFCQKRPAGGLETIFYRYTPQLSEIFWETFEDLFESYSQPILNFQTSVIQARLQEFSKSINQNFLHSQIV